VNWHSASAAVAALALIAPWPAQAQSREPVTFQGETFDLTGASTFELPGLDPVLKPFRREFRDGASLAIELVVDPAGMVQDCRAASGSALSPAGTAFCRHVRAAGHFRVYPLLVLDYTCANLEITIRRREQRSDAETEFALSQPYSLEGQAVRFGSFVVPPTDQRLTLQDLSYRPMEYPSLALRSYIEAQVVVVLSFNETGRVATCRPVFSSNTARMAYETCMEARSKFRLLNPPDARVFAVSTRWVIGG
jgi:hypothetical protein